MDDGLSPQAYVNPPPGAASTLVRPSGRRERRGLSSAKLLEGKALGRLQVAVDVLGMSLAALAALLLVEAAHGSVSQAWILFAFPPTGALMLFMRGMYHPKLRTVILDGVAPVVGAISVAAMVMVAVMVIGFGDARPGALIVRTWLFAVVFVGVGRMAITVAQDRARRGGRIAKPTLIVGAGLVGTHVARRIEESPEYGLKPVGFLDADPTPTVDVRDRRAPVLGSPADLEDVVRTTGAKHVIIAFTYSSDRDLLPLIRCCDELGVEVSLVPRLFDAINDRIALEHIGGLPLIGLRSVDPKGWQFTIKHCFDRAFAGLALLALTPLLILVSITVKLSSPGPVLYRQRRVGRDGQVFDMLKFRSMREVDAGGEDFELAEGSAPGGVEGTDRRTRVGKLLRRTAMDELPQFINVVRGEMSTIGPRPERAEFVELFGGNVNRYADRHRVKSGLSGWAQVHGYRGQTSLADRVEWDNYYIENWSLWLDLKIFVLTMVAVLRGGERS
jgi:exopolysaccharide biosynthesis polyprenyl glycosylphosphotransferase